MESYRDHTSIDQRTANLQHFIDPGFVHKGKIEGIIGPENMQVIDSLIAHLPDMPDGIKEARIDRIYTRVFLNVCEQTGIPTLGQMLARGEGAVFCSTEELAPCPEIWDELRCTSIWVSPGNSTREVVFEYSTDKVRGDTLKSRLASGHQISVVAELRQGTPTRAVFEPIIMGFPVVEPIQEIDWDPSWFGFEFYEQFIEDFDEFERVRDCATPSTLEPMREISEAAFKKCLADLLGGEAAKDWGGEASDFYSAHMHLTGRRVSGAFLLKGPARFAPMGMNHLGKNNDQISRLAEEPADVLFVQHCHDILPAVRKTLRAFAVQPSHPRRYCLIDGRDSLRLLYAYDLYERARELSA